MHYTKMNVIDMFVNVFLAIAFEPTGITHFDCLPVYVHASQDFPLKSVLHDG
jgi:hypothetical protein